VGQGTDIRLCGSFCYSEGVTAEAWGLFKSLCGKSAMDCMVFVQHEADRSEAEEHDRISGQLLSATLEAFT